MEKLKEVEKTEFQKFIFFSRKANELNMLCHYVSLLFKYGGINILSVQKGLRISSNSWSKYYLGKEPLPDGFIEKFEKKFGNKIKECRNQQMRNELIWNRNK